MAGYTLLELVLALGIAATMIGMSVPAARTAIDEMRTAAAARHMAERVALARFDAVKRSAAVGLRFTPAGTDYQFTVHVDGNSNGVRTAEILSGIDIAIARAERLGDKHAGVRFGLLEGAPDLDGARGSEDGVRVGSARILTVSPDGSATPGTVYLRGERSQYAVRCLGATGRTRVFRYDASRQRWESR